MATSNLCLAAGVGAVLAAAAAGSARAEDTAALEEIVVTGTRIVRPDFVSASPILSVTEQRFEESSATSPEQVLNTLPQFVPSFSSGSNNPSNGGQANLSLRGLPTTATLVLLDGRRIMPANGSGVVDVNILPSALIESVEIMTGGASATYGSDAVAGVVNFRLRDEFDGVELNALGGVTDRGDGEETSAGIALGTDFADGRGSIMGYVEYAERELVTYDDRAFSRYGLTYLGDGRGTLGPRNAFVPGGSFIIEEGRARLLASRPAFNALFQTYGYPPNTVPYQRDFGFNDDGTLFTLGALQAPRPGGVANFRGERDPVAFNDVVYGYNFAAPNALQLPLERTSAFGRGEFEFSEAATGYLQALYADYSVSTQLAPTPVQQVTVPVTNPYIPPDLATLLRTRASPAAPFDFAKRMSELGPRQSENDYDVYQVTAGVEGRLSGAWRYDAYLQYGRNENEQRQSNNVRRSRFEELTYAADGGRAACGGFDPFGRGSVSAECAAYVAVDGTNRIEVEQAIAEVSFNGPLLDLPAGELQVALGAMYKQDEYRYQADDISKSFLPDGRSEVLGFNAADDVDGDDHNLDLYVEAAVPLLSGLPGVQSLEAVFGYRWSDYDSAGSVDAYKAELLYQPLPSLRLRGSYQRAVRAPSIFELFLPQLGPQVVLGFPNPDPCSVGSPARTGPDQARVEALCVAQGLPAALLPTYTFLDVFVDGVSGGNPDLGPEEADTYTVGIVVAPVTGNRWLSGVQVALDWYSIEIDDAIGQIPAAAFVTRCYDGRFNPGFAVDNAFCSFFSRNTVSGNVEDAREIYTNVGFVETSGLDLQLDWALDLGPGSVGLNALVSYVDTWERSAGQGVPAEDIIGQIGSGVADSIAEWRSNVRVRYDWAGLGLAAQWRYVDSMRDVAYPDYVVPAQDYYDVFLSYAFDGGTFDGLRFSGGVENVANQQPPIYPTAQQANTDTSLYDVLGRRYFARLTYRF
jgi:outer membrane receptor protein involved in Fe transport